MKTSRWVGILWMIASACGGSSDGDGSSEADGPTSEDGGDDSAAPIAEEDYVATLADLLCDLQAQCTCDNALPEAQCRDMLAEAIESSSAPSPGSGLVFDPQCAGEVVDDWAQLACGSIVEMPAPDCSPCPLYHGSRGAGETCSGVDDGRFDDCDRGLRCGGGGVCIDPCAPVGVGGHCGSQPCADGLFCHYTYPDDGEPTTECRPAAQAGESCSVELECDVGLACSYSGECVEWAGAQVGEPCGYGCAAGLLCDANAGEGAGECHPRGAEGEACIGAADCGSGRCNPGTLTCQAEQAAACLG